MDAFCGNTKVFGTRLTSQLPQPRCDLNLQETTNSPRDLNPVRRWLLLNTQHSDPRGPKAHQGLGSPKRFRIVLVVEAIYIVLDAKTVRHG